MRLRTRAAGVPSARRNNSNSAPLGRPVHPAPCAVGGYGGGFENDWRGGAVKLRLGWQFHFSSAALASWPSRLFSGEGHGQLSCPSFANRQRVGSRVRPSSSMVVVPLLIGMSMPATVNLAVPGKGRSTSCSGKVTLIGLKPQALSGPGVMVGVASGAHRMIGTAGWRCQALPDDVSRCRKVGPGLAPVSAKDAPWATVALVGALLHILAQPSADLVGARRRLRVKAPSTCKSKAGRGEIVKPIDCAGGCRRVRR